MLAPVGDPEMHDSVTQTASVRGQKVCMTDMRRERRYSAAQICTEKSSLSFFHITHCVASGDPVLPEKVRLGAVEVREASVGGTEVTIRYGGVR